MNLPWLKVVPGSSLDVLDDFSLGDLLIAQINGVSQATARKMRAVSDEALRRAESGEMTPLEARTWRDCELGRLRRATKE